MKHFSQSLQQISCPVLLICGEKDKANKAASVDLANRLKNAALEILSKTGHEVNIEAPEELASLIRSFAFASLKNIT